MLSEVLDISDGDAVHACDDEIAMARAYIHDMSARRNAFLSINQLPTEILARIFRNLLPVLRHPLGGNRSLQDVPLDISVGTQHLITSSQVCRRWREVALGSSSLWSTLWLGNARWMHEMLSRSKSAPLTIVQGGWPSYKDSRHQHSAREALAAIENQNFSEILPKLSRTKQVRHLFVLAPVFDNAGPFCEALVLPAPYLEILEISNPMKYIDRLQINAYTVVPDFLGRYAPSMRHLTMEGPLDVSQLWLSPVLRNLVSLTLSFEPLNEVNIFPKVPLRDVLDALRSMHQLEILTISFCSYFLNSPGPSTYFGPSELDQDHSSIRLPRLRHLETGGNLIDITTLTRYLAPHPNMTVSHNVVISNDDVQRGRLSRDMPVLMQPALPLMHFESCEVLFFPNPTLSVQLKCWDHTWDPHGKNTEIPGPRVLLDIHLVDPEFVQISRDLFVLPAFGTTLEKLVQSLNVMLPFLPFDRLQDLHWSSHWMFTSPVSVLTMENVASSQLLETFRTAERLIFKYIDGNTDVLAAAGSDARVFPRLSSIHYIPGLLPQMLSPERVQVLVEQIRRVADCHELKRLGFHGSLIATSYVEMFDGIVPDVLIE